MKHNKFTDKEISEILKNNLVILIDTREKKNQDIVKYFNDKGIRHEPLKLDFGDYSFKIEKCEQLGIMRDQYYINEVAVERKGSLEEVSGNLCQKRTQFENELLRAKGVGCKLFMMIEGATMDDIIHHRYNTQYVPLSFIASLRSFQARYGLHIEFTSTVTAGNSIYYNLFYHARSILKYGGISKAI